MARPPIRLIATDLDGTLLRTDGSVSERTCAAVRRALAAGIEVVPATGRPRIVTFDVISRLPFVDHWIFANGSVTWHQGRSELIRGFWLQPQLARTLITALREGLPEAGFAVEFEDDVAFEAGFEKVVPQVPTVGASEDLLDRIDRRVQKLLVFDPTRSIEELFAEVTVIVGDRGVPSYSGLSFIELAASLVTKATAIELLAKQLGLTVEEVATFGDNHNDVSMLKWSGRSFAMAGATDDAQEAATEIIGWNDDDSVAAKIDELVAETLSNG